jgi:outer membrane protein assembly factor BamB
MIRVASGRRTRARAQKPSLPAQHRSRVACHTAGAVAVCRLSLLAAILVSLLLARPAAGQVSSSSSWPQVGQDPGLTSRTGVTASQTGTPASGFPVPLFGGGLLGQAGQAQAGPPAVYTDGNLLAGTNATQSGTQPMVQLVYINSVGVPQPGATRALFTTQDITSPVGFSMTTPAVSDDGQMFVAGGGILWSVPPSGSAASVFGGTPNQKMACEFLPSAGETTLPICQVGSPTIGPDGTLYFTAGYQPNSPQPGTGAAYALNPSTGQQLWSFPLPQAVFGPVAVDGQGNAYMTAGPLLSVGPTGQSRWRFAPSGGSASLSPPMVYGGTVFVLASLRSGPTTLFAVNASTGRQLWSTRVPGAALSAGPALGPSGNVMALTFTTLAAINRRTGATTWRYSLPSQTTAQVEPMVDGSGDTYVLASVESGGGAVIGVSPAGNQLWQSTIGTGSFLGTTGVPTGGAIGLDGTVYASATDGKVYAFTDPG